MTHSYTVEIALAVGGVREAVVLKEVAFWCKANEGKESNTRDGRTWTYASMKEIQERFPEFSVKGPLAKLRRDGWLIVGAYNDNPYNHRLWYSLSDKSVSLFGQFDLPETENRKDADGQSKKTGKPSVKPTTEEIQKKSADEIDRLYALYPSRTETREGIRSTGKCSKDKVRIAGLLKTHTPEQIERSITRYIGEQDGKYLKNFSTFLNNMPEYEEDPQPENNDGYVDF